MTDFDPDTLSEINGVHDEAPEFIDIDGVRYWRDKPRMEVIDPMKAGVEREGYSRIVINIAPHAKEIRIDHRIYTANQIYEVRDDQVPYFLEVMYRTWQHERAVGGANTNAMVSARNDTFNLTTQAQRKNPGVPGVPGF